MFQIYHAFAAFCLTVFITYRRIAQGITYAGNVPRIGRPGVIGYITTALRYTFDAETVIEEGKAQFSKSPFTIPTLSGPVFFLGPEYLELLRSSTDDIFNEPMAVSDDLQLPYTMDDQQMKNPYQASVLRTDVNRAIPSYIPELLDESISAMQDIFRDKSDTCILPVFETMTHLIARISNRVIFGLQLCRDDRFLQSIVQFAETVTLMAPFIHWSPYILRRTVYLILSNIFDGKKKALKFMVPFLTKLMHDGWVKHEGITTVAEHLMRAAPANETVEGLAIRLLNINFGSIHTSSIFITQTLFEMALLSKEELESIREEVKEVLSAEGGWTKNALLKFRKVDSALREVGRYYGLMHFALPRVSMRDHDLGNGKMIPAGHRVAIDMKAVHFNPEVYPKPHVCDLFRFSKLREDEGNDSKYGFAVVDKHYLPFGAGRHACAGRFFAATELKIMIAHILLNYDFCFPEGVSGRPRNIVFNGAIIPDTKACLLFKRHISSMS